MDEVHADTASRVRTSRQSRNRFHDPDTGVTRGERLDQLLAAYLLAKHRLAVPILAVEVKRMPAISIPTSVRSCMMVSPEKENTLHRNPRVGWGDISLRSLINEHLRWREIYALKIF